MNYKIELNDNDIMKLIIEYTTSIEFHYDDRCSVVITDDNLKNFIKKQALDYIN